MLPQHRNVQGTLALRHQLKAAQDLLLEPGGPVLVALVGTRRQDEPQPSGDFGSPCFFGGKQGEL